MREVASPFKPANACATVLAEVILMAAPAPAKKRPKETLSLEERIRQRAYELYIQRGNQSGSQLDDWLQAEEETLRATKQSDIEG